jgi:hypothetical protein
MQTKLMGASRVDFNATDQLLIRFSAFVRHCRRNGSTMGQYTTYIHTSRMSVIQIGEKYCTVFSFTLVYA